MSLFNLYKKLPPDPQATPKHSLSYYQWGTFITATLGYAKAPNAEVPQIQKISFNKSSITIKGEGFDKVSWYFNNEIVHTGETFDLIKNGSEELFYVYFMAQTSDFSIEKKQGAVIGSQPFWFKKID